MSVSETLPQVDTNTIVNGYTRLQSPEMRVAAPAASPGHMAPGSRSSSSTVSSLVDTELVWAESEEERLTVERIHQTKRQLQTEIDVRLLCIYFFKFTFQWNNYLHLAVQ